MSETLARMDKYREAAVHILGEIRAGRGAEVREELALRLLEHERALHDAFLELATKPYRDWHDAKAMVDLHRAYKDLAHGVWDKVVMPQRRAKTPKAKDQKTLPAGEVNDGPPTER